jgi:FkbM family methyltransferase
VEKDPPPDVYRDFLAIYRSLELLRNFKFNPDFVLDVGASTGIWSHVVCKLFPNARYVLVEPLASIYRKQNDYLFVNHPTFDFVEAALSDHAGTMTMYVSSNFYGSSLFRAAVINNQEQTIEVEVKTLDQLAEEKRISGRGLLKMDVQYAEHLVLAGAAHFIEQVDAIAIELSLRNLPHEAKTFLQMQNMMNDLGFEYFDDVGEWRSSKGVLEQKDVLFVRRRSVTYQELCAVYENGSPA